MKTDDGDSVATVLDVESPVQEKVEEEKWDLPGGGGKVALCLDLQPEEGVFAVTQIGEKERKGERGRLWGLADWTQGSD